MSDFEFPAFPSDALSEAIAKAGSKRTATMILPAVEAAWADAAAAFNSLGAVRDAASKADELLETSETEEAGKFRNYRDKVTAKTSEKEAKANDAKAKYDAVLAEIAAEYDNVLKEANAGLEKLRVAARKVVAADSVSDINTGDLSSTYDQARGEALSLLNVLKRDAKVEVPPVSLPTVQRAIEGKRGGSGKIAESQRGWTPRFTNVTVDGVEVKGTEKDGIVKNPTAGQAAKQIGISRGAFINQLQDRLGAREFTPASLTDGTFTFPVNYNEKDYSVTVTPDLKADDDDED